MRQNKLRYFWLVLAWVMVFPAIVNAAPEKNSNPYPLTDFSKPLLITPQTTMITINLPTNPSTGYQWFLLQYNDKLLEPVGYRYIASSSKIMGSPGISSWQFQIKKTAFIVPRVAHIEFEYRRSWEENTGNRQAVTVITGVGQP